MTDTQYRVVCVLAEDWCYYENQLPKNHKFQSIEAMIVGFVIEEDEEKIVLAHQVFDDEQTVRHVSVITKSSIIDLVPMMKDDSEGEDD